MSHKVLLPGLLVDTASYCFRYPPLRLYAGNACPAKRDAVGILLDTIGIASIYTLLAVSTTPGVMHGTRRSVPALVGFTILGVSPCKTCSVITPTLFSVLAYGLVWKVMTVIRPIGIVFLKQHIYFICRYRYHIG